MHLTLTVVMMMALWSAMSSSARKCSRPHGLLDEAAEIETGPSGVGEEAGANGLSSRVRKSLKTQGVRGACAQVAGPRVGWCTL